MKTLFLVALVAAALVGCSATVPTQDFGPAITGGFGQPVTTESGAPVTGRDANSKTPDAPADGGDGTSS